MDKEFWHSKWAANRIGFHMTDVNPLLLEYWPALSPQREEQVFVPLCGKSEDLVWLAAKHDRVIGVELSEIAVRSFFSEHFYTPLVTQIDSFHQCYEFDELQIYQGDVFTAPLEHIELIYDRAALVSIMPSQRDAYIQRLRALLKPGGRMLLISVDYEQTELAGPPFSVDRNQIQHLFQGMKMTLLCRKEADPGHPKIAKQKLSRFADEVWLIEA
ncbi:thiopurine S-methyltransferase [Vibrio gazogenes]|uniref:Thiopurine S-methyltransferase n=1 Tax=Vibrio gazogenes TaxID=687 RepID=A0A1Z2SBY6_VIBGA|nr:thiopurine S-methyltransferase [Vibrio gazogenes]ASA54693.1 thiopurine S-methyltransferase [Vibrio gazogenes]